MNVSKLKPFDIIICTWEDAWGDSATAYDSNREALAAYRPLLRKTVGWYVGVAECDGRRALIMGSDDDRVRTDGNGVGGLIFTPEGMVISIEKLASPLKKFKKS